MKRAVLLLAALVVAACSDQAPLVDPEMTESPQVADLTPFQQSIQDFVARRSDGGLPVPEVSFDYSSDNGASLAELQNRVGAPGESFTIVATTTIRYRGPSEAGFDRWPPTVVRGEIPAEEGFIRPGDYTNAVRDYIEDRLPGYWDQYEYGLEPRTRRVTETLTVTYPDPRREGAAMAAADEDLVHGFTVSGPDIDWTVRDEACAEILGVEVCAWKFRAGFALDYALGLRLPMNVSLTTADAVDEGTTFTPTSLAHGVDWSAGDYAAAGIAGEDGNEFVMRHEFFLGAYVEVAEIPVIDIGPKSEKEIASSFATPFGPGQVFNLPTLDIPILERSLAEVSFEFGVGITPQAGSDKFLAGWTASSGLSGNGLLTYTNPAVARPLSSVFAVDGPGIGNLRISDTRYVFNQFKVALSAYFAIDIFGLFDDRYPIPIVDFDLSDIFPDIAAPIHAGASPTVLNSGVTISNVAPTAEIDLSGAQVINGADVFFADVGEVMNFRGSSHDPGRDDVVAEWNFGDGSPVVTVDYPLAGPVGPNDVTDLQARAYGSACFYPITFRVTDSDGASSEDAAAVVIRSAAGGYSRLAGYWTHQFSGNGNVDFTPEELGCLLQILASTSTVFNEVRDASTVPLGLAVLSLNGNQGSEAEKLDRELLIAWLNFAAGVFDLDEMVDTNFDGVADTSFGVALAIAEAVRTDPLATAKQLRPQREIVHDIVAQKTAS